MTATLAMAVHFHQPVGNFDHVIEGACQRCYLPFLETLKKYPDIKMTVHFTGCLLEWCEDKNPEILNIIKELVRSGQIEIMSGGFYEPILTSIPDRDRLDQIKMLSEYVEEKFAYKAQGAWIAERVWEPGLPHLLKEAEVKYVILDDTHFLYSGVPKDRTYGYYTTEDSGKVVNVFPSDKVLRYLIPYKMPEEIMGYMHSIMEQHGDPLFVYGDDGEKFGEWPGTYKWVFEEKWLTKFFDAVVHNRKWLRTVKMSECLESRSSLGRVYIPTTSYEEMLEWALPVDSQMYLEDVLQDIRDSGKEEWYKPFIRGGFWRNFFMKYPESNNMNKKMLYVSNKLEMLKNRRRTKESDVLEAQKELFKGQCNCSYWHGVFGGLYLFHLRKAIYHHLINSEVILSKLVHRDKDFCELEEVDMNADGEKEILLSNKYLSLYLDPKEGGVLKELDSRVICHNITNSLSRREEAYHRKIVKRLASQQEEGNSEEPRTIHDGVQEIDGNIENNLQYDWYTRYSLIDHFISCDTTLKDFSACEFNEVGDFVLGRYMYKTNSGKNNVSLEMYREGKVSGQKVSLKKEIVLPKRENFFSVKYSIVNMGTDMIDVCFSPEFNIVMPNADSDRCSFFTSADTTKKNRISDIVEENGLKSFTVEDEIAKIFLKYVSDREFTLWHFPLKTVSQSEKAYELNYQNSVMAPIFTLHLKPGFEEQFTMDIRVAAR